jgi:hypothetical protein
LKTTAEKQIFSDIPSAFVNLGTFLPVAIPVLSLQLAQNTPAGLGETAKSILVA